MVPAGTMVIDPVPYLFHPEMRQAKRFKERGHFGTRQTDEVDLSVARIFKNGFGYR